MSPEYPAATLSADGGQGRAEPGRRSRILLVHNYYRFAGGEDAVVANEKDLLIQNGHGVTQYSVDNHGIVDLADKARVFLDVPYSKPSRDAFARHLGEMRPDIVHVHNFFPLLTTSIYDACKAAGVPVVQTLHNFRITCAGALLQREGKLCEKCVGGSPYWGVVHRCYRNSVVGSFAVARMIEANRRADTWSTKVDCFVALSEIAKSRYVRAGVPAERIVVKPNFAPDPGEPRAGSRHGALFVGRLSEEKGGDVLTTAWRSVDYPLRIAGDGPLAPQLRTRAPANVTFLGQISPQDVRREMAAAAVLIVPSTCLEAFPLVLAEAFAAGLPVIVSDIGALQEIVEQGVTGVRVPVGQPDTLAAAVNGLVDDPETLNAYGSAARRTYLARYSPNANYQQLLSIYERVCPPAHPRARSTSSRDTVLRDTVGGP